MPNNKSELFLKEDNHSFTININTYNKETTNNNGNLT